MSKPRLFRQGAICTLLLGALPAGSVELADVHPQARSFFPEAERFGALQGDPPAVPVYQNDEVVGYVFATSDVVKIPAYSGKPVNLLVGIDTRGRIRGSVVLEHHEPILLIGIPERELDRFAGDYVGKSVSDRIRVGAPREGFETIDAITGATVTVIVVNRTILQAARRVAAARGIIEQISQARAPPALVRRDFYMEGDWKELTGNGAIRRLLLTNGEVESAFAGTAAAGQMEGKPEDIFIDLYYAYLNAPTIGRNLLGERQYNWLMAELGPGEHAIAVMADGEYSFKGSGYVRGGIFDRIQLVQDDRTYSFRDLDHYPLSDVFLVGMPPFSERGIFIVRREMELDPGRAWGLELLVRRQIGPVESEFTSFSGAYQIPDAYVERVTPPPQAVDDLAEPMWVGVWQQRSLQIAVLGLGLGVLILIMVFQDWLVRFPRLITSLRNGFLVFSALVIGWYMLGQLSVVNVLTFLNAIIGGFNWDTFLIDPVMFILWSFVAVTLLLWGRGVYCGWLCPYGALQKLINEAARRLRLPQLKFPTLVHDRLWALKYVILLILFGISLQSMGTAERYAEVEPFKTAIALRFDRQWPFVLYAGGLLLVSAFNCKFFCKYLCPLGAALAVPARLRLFNWLRRRKECGRPCQICANECEIQAINDTGEINANECHYCLDCQLIYWDDHQCPPLVERRKRREKGLRAKRSVRWMEEELGAKSGLGPTGEPRETQAKQGHQSPERHSHQSKDGGPS